MKLSEFKNEAAVDVLADLLEPASTICSDAELVKAVREKQPILKIAQIALKKHQKAVVEVLAIINGVSVDEFECTPVSILNDLLGVLNDAELVEFFMLQGRTRAESNSGSAMESTKELERQSIL